MACQLSASAETSAGCEWTPLPNLLSDIQIFTSKLFFKDGSFSPSVSKSIVSAFSGLIKIQNQEAHKQGVSAPREVSAVVCLFFLAY